MRRWATLCAALLACTGRAEASCNWKPTELLKLTGDVQQGDLSGPFSRTVAPASGRFVESMNLGTLSMGTGFDGRLAWSRDFSGASHYLNSDFARRLAVSEAWLSDHLGCTRQAGADVQHFTPPGGAPIDLNYDRRTGRLDRAMLQYPENRLIHHYADWRAVAPGYFMPFSQRDEDPEDESDTVYKVKHVVRLKSASFAPPLPPRDSRIVGGGSTTISFEDDHRRRVFLPVYLNGKGPFAFELDNGGHFILTEETAAALGLATEGAFSSTGAGNEVRHGGYARIARLRLGNAEMLNQPAKVMALSHNDRGKALPRAGILGLEFFERFVVAVDHRNKTVTLSPIDDSARTHPGRAIPLLFDQDAALADGSFEGVKGNVMLDIGNAGPTIIEDYWAAQHGFRSRLAAGTPRGDAKLSIGSVGVGPFVLDGETVEYFGPAERGSEYTRSIAAVLGEPLLSRFNAVYDYGRGKVWLEPLPDVQPLTFERRP
jgi:hypothetical protein